MESYLEIFFPWLLRTSWQAAVLVLAVLILQGILQRKLSARWRHALWLVVVARLMMPFSPESGVSLFNYARIDRDAAAPVPSILSAPEKTFNGFSGDQAFFAAAPSLEFSFDQEGETEAVKTDIGVPPMSRIETTEIKGRFRMENFLFYLAAIWLLVVLLLSGRIAVQNFRFSRRLRSAIPVVDPDLHQIFAQCKALLKTTRTVRLLETDALKSPAVFGLIRPVVLLPSDIVGTFTQMGLRYIFLHELAHVKRRDMALHWLTTVLKIVHWFNPLIAYGFRRMAADRELACDELALLHGDEEERQLYGETILKLLENPPRQMSIPGIVGISNDKRQMTRRIRMISRFKRPSRWSLAAAAVVAVLGLIGLTDARTRGEDSEPAMIFEIESVSDSAEKLTIRGRVLDSQGQPVQRAVARVNGIKRNGRTWWSSEYDYIEQEAITDENGEFVLRATEPFEEAGFIVEAYGLAPRAFPLMAAGETVHELVMDPGVTVTGRVVKNGIPLAGVGIGLLGVRAIPEFSGDFTAQTDEAGRFTFLNIPLQREYLVYGLMESLKGEDVIPVQRILLDEKESILGGFLYPILEPRPATVSEDGSSYDIGDLFVEKGYQLSGKIELTDGKPLPDGSRLILSRWDPRDSLEVPIAADGRFRFDGLPGEPIELFPRVPGYRLSLRNVNLDPRYRGALMGRLQGDKTDLIVELEPGGRREMADGNSDVLREKILRGVEETETADELRLDGPSGLILKPNGEPASGVLVYLIPLEDSRTLQIQGEKVEIGKAYPGVRITTTDRSGRFSFAAGEEPYGIVAMGESGYAEATMEEVDDSGILLKPWARVEGQLRIGSEPGANETIRLGLAYLPYEYSPRIGPPISLFLETITDSDGNFVFERVPPLHLKASHSPAFREGRSGPISQTQTRMFTAAPGETHRVVMGGEGRPIVGQLVVKNYPGKIDWLADVHSLESQPQAPSGLPDTGNLYREYQESLEGAATEEEKEVLRAVYEKKRAEANERARRFYTTEEGRDYWFSHRQFVLDVAPDGHFRTEDVPSGTYRLKIHLNISESNEWRPVSQYVLMKQVEIPPTPGDRSDEPYDLGILEFVMPSVPD